MNYALLWGMSASPPRCHDFAVPLVSRAFELYAQPGRAWSVGSATTHFVKCRDD